jgi:acyl-CoA thioester hydrolase
MVVALRARFRDTDGMGHVNNAVFFTYFEEARAAYFRQVAGVECYRDVKIILARAICDFRSPLASGEAMDLGVRMDRIGRKSFAMSYRAVARPDGRLVAEGDSILVAYDYGANRSVEVPEEFRKQAEAFEGRSFPADAQAR